MLLLDRILTHIVNHLSNTSYHFQYLYYPGGNETGAKPNLITCITEIFLSVSRVLEPQLAELSMTLDIHCRYEPACGQPISSTQFNLSGFKTSLADTSSSIDFFGPQMALA